MGKGVTKLRRELGTWPREIVVTLVVTILAPAALAIVLGDEVPVWVAVLAGGLGVCVGIIRGASGEHSAGVEDAEAKLTALEDQVVTLGAYDTYAIHVRDALGDLRKVLADELSNFSLRDFVETGSSSQRTFFSRGIAEESNRSATVDEGITRDDYRHRRFSVLGGGPHHN